jgi:hypothetical protein
MQDLLVDCTTVFDTEGDVGTGNATRETRSAPTECPEAPFSA